jgi:hypothetical protein
MVHRLLVTYTGKIAGQHKGSDIVKYSLNKKCDVLEI